MQRCLAGRQNSQVGLSDGQGFGEQVKCESMVVGALRTEVTVAPLCRGEEQVAGVFYKLPPCTQRLLPLLC